MRFSEFTDEKDQAELRLEVIAFVMTGKTRVAFGDAQMLFMIRILQRSKIGHALSVHLFLNPSLEVLFNRLRDAILNQKEDEKEADLKAVARIWAAEVMNGELKDEFDDEQARATAAEVEVETRRLLN